MSTSTSRFAIYQWCFAPCSEGTDYIARGAIASVLSLYYRVVLQRDPTDTTWQLGYTLLWTYVSQSGRFHWAVLTDLSNGQVEMWSGVTASCMPTVKQFFSHYFPTASLKAVSKLSTSHFKHENQEKSYKSRGAFRLWGTRAVQTPRVLSELHKGQIALMPKQLTLLA